MILLVPKSLIILIIITFLAPKFLKVPLGLVFPSLAPSGPPSKEEIEDEDEALLDSITQHVGEFVAEQYGFDVRFVRAEEDEQYSQFEVSAPRVGSHSISKAKKKKKGDNKTQAQIAL